MNQLRMIRRRVAIPILLMVSAVGLFYFCWRSESEVSLSLVAERPGAIGNAALSIGALLDAEGAKPLPHPNLIAGRVVSTSGRGLLATVCSIIGTAYPSEGAPCFETDAQGNFSFSLTHDGPYTVSALASGHLPASRQLSLRDAPSRVDFVLEPGGVNVEGVTLDAKGGNVPGALVVATPKGHPDALAQGVSDKQGRFHLQVPAGDTRIAATAPGYAEARLALVAPASALTLVLTPGSTIVGRVVAGDAVTGVAGALVSARPRNGRLSQLRPTATSEDGSFRIEGVSAGGYDLVATASELRSDPAFVRVDVASESEKITLVMAPAARVTATLAVGDRPCIQGQVHLIGSTALHATTTAAGEVEFLAVPAGLYRVQATCVTGSPGQFELQVPEPSARKVTHQTWRLETGHEVHGRVSTTTGRGVEGIRILLAAVTNNDRVMGSAAPDCLSVTDGVFRCGGVQVGRYRCSAEGQESPTDAVEIAVPHDAPVELKLPGRGTIQAVLSTPVAAVTVFAKGLDGRQRIGRSAGANTFVFTSLPLGVYEVGVPESQAVRIQLVRDGQVAEVKLQVATASLTGHVVDSLGMPVVEAWVQAHGNGAAGTGSEAIPTLTDDNGEFAIHRVSPGRYSIAVTSSNGEAVVEDAHTGQPQRITLVSYGSMSGRVLSSSGQPVQRFQLSYSNGDTEHVEQVASAGGQWSVPWIEPGTWTIEARTEMGVARQQVRLLPAKRVQVDLRLEGAQVDVHDPGANWLGIDDEPQGQSDG